MERWEFRFSSISTFYLDGNEEITVKFTKENNIKKRLASK